MGQQEIHSTISNQLTKTIKLTKLDLMDEKRYKTIQKTLAAILGLNLLVAIFKIIIGTLTQSSAILADGFHSISDGSGNVIGLVAMKFASKPEDEDHPYGHQKIEMLGSFIIVIILTFLGFEIIMNAIDKFIHPVDLSFTALSFGIMIFTFIVNIIVYKSEYAIGVKTNATILKVDSMHTKNDLVVTLGVMASMLLVQVGFPIWIDPLLSLFIAFYIFKAAWEMFREISPVLLDEQVISNEDIQRLRDNFQQIKEIHKVRSRGTNDSLLVDMHVVIDPQTTVLVAHDLSHKIEAFIDSQYPDKKVSVICHIEPFDEVFDQNRKKK